MNMVCDLIGPIPAHAMQMHTQHHIFPIKKTNDDTLVAGKKSKSQRLSLIAH